MARPRPSGRFRSPFCGSPAPSIGTPRRGGRRSGHRPAHPGGREIDGAPETSGPALPAIVHDEFRAALRAAPDEAAVAALVAEACRLTAFILRLQVVLGRKNPYQSAHRVEGRWKSNDVETILPGQMSVLDDDMDRRIGRHRIAIESPRRTGPGRPAGGSHRRFPKGQDFDFIDDLGHSGHFGDADADVALVRGNIDWPMSVTSERRS